MSPAALSLLEAAQFAGILGGLLLLWRLGLSAEARRTPAGLSAWAVSGSDFLLFVWLVICGGLVAPWAATLWLRHTDSTPDFRLILGTAVFQLGMLAGVGLFHVAFGRRTPPADPVSGAARHHPLLAGAAACLFSLPVVLVASLLWQGLLRLCHLPAPPQEAIEILRRVQGTLPGALLLLSAVGLAPVTEELIFRAGLFRYLRTRLPRWAALLLPAVIFGAMHANLASFAPLVALGLVFALAYERTGRISTTIVAHALFNLTATLLVLAGVDL